MYAKRERGEQQRDRREVPSAMLFRQSLSPDVLREARDTPAYATAGQMHVSPANGGHILGSPANTNGGGPVFKSPGKAMANGQRLQVSPGKFSNGQNQRVAGGESQVGGQSLDGVHVGVKEGDAQAVVIGTAPAVRVRNGEAAKQTTSSLLDMLNSVAMKYENIKWVAWLFVLWHV
jgi:hypothetical protein